MELLLQGSANQSNLLKTITGADIFDEVSEENEL